jgi:hypothetical protein
LRSESSNTVWSAPFVNDGASFTAVRVIQSLFQVSAPPFAVPPSSLSLTLIVAVPLAFAAGVYVKSPVTGLIAGATLNNDGLLFSVTANVNVCPLSFAAPFDIALAQPATLCAPSLQALSGRPPL